MEITIFTLYSNRPDFIKLQKNCFNKLQDKFKWIVVNNSCYIDDKPEEIELECVKEGVECLNLRHFEAPDVSKLVADSLDFLWKEKISKLQGGVVIMDCDLFLTKKVSFAELLKGYDMFFCPRYTQGVMWAWAGFMGFNMDTVVAKDVNFQPIKIKGESADVGAGTAYYIQQHTPKVNLIPREEVSDDKNKNLSALGFPKPYSLDFLPFAIHYKTSGNYAEHCTPEYNQAKTQALLKVI